MRAVQELENAVPASPRDPEALRALAEAEFELARYGRALAHARRAAMLAPARGPLPRAGGRRLFKLRRYKEAAEAYGVAVALAPGDAAIRVAPAAGPGEDRQRRRGQPVGGDE